MSKFSMATVRSSGTDGCAHVVAGADEAELLGAEQREDERAAAPPAAAKARARPRTTAVPEALSSAPGWTAPPTTPEVIVVRAEDDGLAGERRIGARAGRR